MTSSLFYEVPRMLWLILILAIVLAFVLNRKLRKAICLAILSLLVLLLLNQAKSYEDHWQAIKKLPETILSQINVLSKISPAVAKFFASGKGKKIVKSLQALDDLFK